MSIRIIVYSINVTILIPFHLIHITQEREINLKKKKTQKNTFQFIKQSILAHVCFV